MLAVNEKIQALLQQLRGFSVTAKLLIAALMIIMVMSLLFVAQFAARPRMIPLGLNASLSEESRARAVSFLDTRGIQWAEREGDLLVPADERYIVLARLTENDFITTDQIDFDSVAVGDSPFTDRATKRERYLIAKMNVLSRMISELSGIESARVVIDHPERSGGLGAARIEPTASVNVRTTGEPLSQKQADAIARMVAGSHAALKIDRVSITDARTGTARRPRSDEDLASSRHLDSKQATEKYVRDKIYDMLSHISGLKVAVNVQVDTSEVVTHRIGVEEPKHGVRREESREFASTNQSNPIEPGVRPNTGQDLSASSSRISSLTENENRTDTIPAFPTQETRERHTGGHALKINATVRVPRSYFVRIYRQEQRDEAATPDDASLQPVVDRETGSIEKSVLPLIDTGVVEGAVPGTLVVSMFADLADTGVVAAGSGMLTGSGAVVEGMLSGDIVRAVGLGALALISLLLMLMVVRSASRREEMPSAEELVGIPPALTEADSDLVGEAAEATPAMEGVELDESDVRRSQMLRQINDLALNSSDEAAGLMRKWLKSDR